jgi:hypothetical protein
MSAMLTLDQLAAEGGDAEVSFSNKKTGKWESPFTVNKAYPVELTETTPVVSKNGYYQLEVKLSIIGADGVTSAGREWIGLPAFSDEVKATIEQEKLTTLTDTFGKGLHGILRAVDPGTWSVYSRCEKTGKKWKFFDANDEEMAPATKVAREKAIGRALVGAAKRLHDGTMSIAGARMFVVRTENKKTPGKFYMNFYAEQPTSYEMAEV